jgi:hypothetical protein
MEHSKDVGVSLLAGIDVKRWSPRMNWKIWGAAAEHHHGSVVVPFGQWETGLEFGTMVGSSGRHCERCACPVDSCRYIAHDDHHHARKAVNGNDAHIRLAAMVLSTQGRVTFKRICKLSV